MRRLLIGAILLAMLVAVPAAVAAPPTVNAQLLAAVQSSRANVRLLIVDTRTRKLWVDVSVRDPAAYLKHRYARVVAAIYPRLVERFRTIRLHVFDARSGRAVLSYSDVVTFGLNGRTREESWHIAYRYLDCARDLPLDDIEIDPDHAAPHCPAT